MRTTFIVFNPTGISDTASIRLTDDSGQPLVVTIPGLGTADQFGPLTIGPGQTRILQTAGTGNARAGAARVESSLALGVSAILTLYTATGGFLTEAGVGSSTPMDNFIIPVDASTGFNTGVALFAPAGASLDFTLRTLDGTVAGTSTNNQVGPQGHVARFVKGTGGLFPDSTIFTRGTLEVSASAPVAAVVMRQHEGPLTNTTLPAVDRASSTLDFNFPQIANGVTPSGLTMKTTFILFNISQTEAIAEVSVKRPNGVQFPVVRTENLAAIGGTRVAALPAQGVIASDFAVHMKPGVSAFITTTGTGDLSPGSAHVQSTVPIGVAAIFTVSTGASGTVFMTEAGVGDSMMRSQFTLPVEVSLLSGTGVALFNPNDNERTVNIWLNDENGVSVGQLTTPVVLPPFSQTAKFVSELFPDKTNFRGSMGVSASGGIV
ncbi:MAG: hypothetical protein EHM23_07930, partial [Acidobacteria bacterium]